MIIDAHAHIGHWPSLKESEENILRSQEKYGVAFSLVSNADAGEYQSLDKFGEQRHEDSLSALKAALRFQKEHPSRIGVFYWIRPTHETLSTRIISFLKKHREEIRGLKIHPYCSRMRVDAPEVEPYLLLAEEFGWPVLVHTAIDEYSDIRFLRKVAAKHPSITFVAAHANLCTDDKRSVYRALRLCPNILIDTAWVKARVALKIIHEFGKERVLFGTDNPIDGVDTLANPMYAPYLKKDSRFSDEEWDAIMWKNAKRVYRL